MSCLKSYHFSRASAAFDLGLERTGGFETVAFCEIEPFAVRVLNKHWPGVPVYGDVRELTGERIRADGIVPDVIAGGFPCQDISNAGSREGIAGARSGLWSEFNRIICELRPSLVIVENVSALLSRGLGRVLGDLAAVGYDAEWHCIPAAALGAPHVRDRLWIIAYPQHSNANGIGSHRAPKHHGRVESGNQQGGEPRSMGQVLAHSASIRYAGSGLLTQWCRPEANGAREAAYALSGGKLGQWSLEPELGRVANGVPDRAHRLKGLGNAVTPVIPELIGRAILASLEQDKREAA